MTWAQITQFLENRCYSLENSQAGSSKGHQDHKKPEHKRASANTASKISCGICKKGHYSYQCPQFVEADVKKKRFLVKKSGLCFNCLSTAHKVGDCPSTKSCNECGERHYSKLHINFPPKNGEQSQPKNKDNNKATTNHAKGNSNTVILPTARVLVQNKHGEFEPYRALIDSGSQINIISEKAVDFLGLKKQKTSVTIAGIGGESACDAKGEVNIVISSKLEPQFKMEITAVILRKVTSPTQATRVTSKFWSKFNKSELADPQYNQPGHIDLLLGADVMFSVLGNKLKKGGPRDPVALWTKFGWIIGGSASQQHAATKIYCNLATVEAPLDQLLHRFWAVEEPPAAEKKHLTEDERKCEAIFQTTTTRGEDGKFIVKIPFKDEQPNLGKSRTIAMKRLSGVEARLSRVTGLRQQYEEFMDEYEKEGHMTEITEEDPKQEEATYLPHHPVIRQTALTTKLRVVFDASAKTENGHALNGEQLVGPTVQDDLVSIFMRFRLHKVAINSDIKAMYRQIWITPEQRDLQRIL